VAGDEVKADLGRVEIINESYGKFKITQKACL
jgi:hypothetical protein